MSIKLVIAAGGCFSISKEAFYKLREWNHPEVLEEEIRDDLEEVGLESYSWYLKRDDPMLFRLIDEIGIERVSAIGCELKIVEIPDGVRYCIYECEGGGEFIYDLDRSWR